MFILLILLTFILLSLSFFGSDSISNERSFLFEVRLAKIKAFIGIALISYIICEILSLFNVFSFKYVLISWVLINVVIIFLNIEKIKAALPYYSMQPLNVGLKKTIEWFYETEAYRQQS